MNPQLQARIEEIEKRCERATSGKWHIDDELDATAVVSGTFLVTAPWKIYDAKFIAASREDVPFLISELRKAHMCLNIAETELRTHITLMSGAPQPSPLTDELVLRNSECCLKEIQQIMENDSRSPHAENGR